MQKAILKVFNILFVFFIISSNIIYAKNVKKIKTFKNWDVIATTQCQENKCYIESLYVIAIPASRMLSQEIHQTGNIFDLAPPYIMIKQARQKAWTISIKSRLPESVHGIRSSLLVGARPHSLYADRNDFFTTISSMQDIALLNSIIEETEGFIEVHTYSNHKKIAIDTYNLNGLKEALIYMEQRHKSIA